MSAWVKPPAGTTSSRKMAPLGPTYLAVAITVLNDEQVVVPQTWKVSLTPTTGGMDCTGGAPAPKRAPGEAASARSRIRSMAWKSSAVPAGRHASSSGEGSGAAAAAAVLLPCMA